MSADKRARKRFQRENRKDKGVAAEAKRQEYNRMVRERRDSIGMFDGDDAMMMGAMLPFLAAASKRGRPS